MALRSTVKAIYFYCCQCRNGPLRWGSDLVCWECNHRRCQNCIVDGVSSRHAYSSAGYLPRSAIYQTRLLDDETLSSDAWADDDMLSDPAPPWSWVEKAFEESAQEPGEPETAPSEENSPDLPQSSGSNDSSITRDRHIVVQRPHDGGTRLSSFADTPNPEKLLSSVQVMQVVDPANGWFRRQKEPKLPPGFVRVRFRCACGVLIWDDYPGTAEKVIPLLNSYVQDVSRQSPAPGAPTSNGGRNWGFKSLFSSCKRLMGIAPIANNAGGRPAAPTDSEAQLRSGAQPSQASEPYYLTCVRQDSRIPSLEQIGAATINSDQDYFEMLRAISKPKRWSLRWMFRLRKVTSIRYVKFALYFDNKYVQIERLGDLPKEKEHYDPCDDDFGGSSGLCVWAPNALLHYYEKRHAFWEHPKILPSIPRKIKGKLVVPADCASKEGWGMQVLDGIDRLRVALIGVVGLLLSSFVGILWAKLHNNDIQGGAGLTQCLTGFVTFLVTMHGVVGFVEQQS